MEVESDVGEIIRNPFIIEEEICGLLDDRIYGLVSYF